MASRQYNATGRNRLLTALPRDVYRRIEPHLEKQALGLKAVLFESNAPIEHVYFPLSGVMSLVVTMEDGGTVEVSTIGNEGMVGVPVLLGAETSPARAFSQVPGEVLRMTSKSFKEELAKPDGHLRRLISKYAQTLFSQISQSVACNHLHSVEERTCRWLLMTHDRVGQDQFLLTQEFLAQMLVSAGRALRLPRVCSRSLA